MNNCTALWDSEAENEVGNGTGTGKLFDAWNSGHDHWAKTRASERRRQKQSTP